MIQENHSNRILMEQRKNSIEYLFVVNIRNYLYAVEYFTTLHIHGQGIEFYKNKIKEDSTGKQLIKKLINQIINNQLNHLRNRYNACFVGLLIKDVLWESLGIESEYVSNHPKFRTFKDTVIELVKSYTTSGNYETLTKFLHAASLKVYPGYFTEFYENLCIINRQMAYFFTGAIRLEGLLGPAGFH
jgi:hypothetical protein